MNENRHAFVTGTSRGLGHGLAEELLRRGWRVTGSARGAVALGERYRHLVLDQAHPAELDAGLAALEGTAAFDLVVLNAGVLGPIGEFHEVSVAESKHVMDVNLWANKALIDGLATRELLGAQLVAISSGAAVNGHRGWGPYAVSKAALNMLISLYAAELDSTHCAALAPGLVDTAMQDELRGLTPDERYPSLEVLRGRQGTPDMPTASEVAPRMLDAILRLPGLCESGAFVDLRSLPPR